MIFRYSQYADFLARAKQAGPVVPLGEWDRSNAIILRHDVDFDIEAAWRLAQVEAQSGVRASYFIMVTCHNYNPLSRINRTHLRRMTDKGFEIGLHFDPMIYGEADADRLRECLDHEARLLATVSGKPVRSVSLHNPAINGQYPLFEGYCNAYDSRIFSDGCYLSDSRMDFRGKNPYEFVQRVKEFPIQILLHPLHYSENGDAYPEYFCRKFKSYIDTIDEEFRLNATYSRLMPCDLFSYVIAKGGAQ